MFMSKKGILVLISVVTAICGAVSYALAAPGDRTVVTTTSCSGNFCVETQTIYEETWANGFVIISSTSRTYQRSNAER
jgi:hypothetical protein